jgi:hypothetical protein
MKQSIPHVIDTNREGIVDKNDCTVRAIKNGFGITYKEAHRLCSEAGRKINKGANMSNMVVYVAKAKAKKVKQFQLPFPITLEKYMQLCSLKTQICLIRKHTFVVKKKVVHDHLTNKATKLVYSYWVTSEPEKFKCPIEESLKSELYLLGFPSHALAGKTVTRNSLRTQEDVIYFLHKLGKEFKIDLTTNQIADLSGIPHSNVSHLHSKMKLGTKECTYKIKENKKEELPVK